MLGWRREQQPQCRKTPVLREGALANMEVLNGGAMSWNAHKNVWTYSRAVNAQPTSVVVGNTEGYRIVPVVTAVK
jgi:hypothetical protein